MRKENNPEVESLNVLILPDSQTSQKAINLSGSIAENFDTRFVLDGVNLLPHLTLYLTEFPTRSIAKLESIISEEVSGLSTIDVEMGAYSDLSGFIFWDAKMSDELYQAHERMLERLSPFREEKEKYRGIDLPGISMGQADGLKKYGYSLALGEYRPHITLIRLENIDEVKSVVKSLPIVKSSFRASTLAFVRAGAEGTCPRNGIIKKFDLTQ